MAVLLAEQSIAWGSIERGALSPVRAYDGLGDCFSFIALAPDHGCFAMDLEAKGLPASEAIEAALGIDGLGHWVEIEVIAKLANVPAHLVFKRYVKGEMEQMKRDLGIDIVRCDTASYWIAVGRCDRPDGSALIFNSFPTQKVDCA
jgi:hypothetical protein